MLRSWGFQIDTPSKSLVFARQHFRDLTDQLAKDPEFPVKLMDQLSRLIPFNIGQIKVVPTRDSWLWKSPRRTTHKTSGKVVRLLYEDTMFFREFLEGEGTSNFKSTYPLKKEKYSKVHGLKVAHLLRRSDLFWYSDYIDMHWYLEWISLHLRLTLESHCISLPVLARGRQSHGMKTVSSHYLKQLLNFEDSISLSLS